MKSKDPLFLGMSRPPMIGGVTFMYMGLNGMGVAFLFTLTANLFVLLLFIPIHAVGYAICLKDPQLLDVFVKKLQKTSGVTNKKMWSGSSYER